MSPWGQRGKKGMAGLAPFERWVKEGRAYTGKKGCLDRSKLLWRHGFGEVFPIYVMQGRGFGIMVKDKRERPLTDLSGKKENPQK